MQTKQNPYFIQQALGILVALFYKVWSSTFRYQVEYEDKKTLDENQVELLATNPNPNNFIYAFWHQDELALLPYFEGLKIVAMVSLSKDGTIMSTALEEFGYKTVRGSSHRRGLGAFLEGMKMVRNFYSFTMAVDGPKGPAFVVKEGIIQMSKKTDKLIVPIRAYPHRYKLFEKAWNQARLPLPFSKIVMKVGSARRYELSALQNKLETL